MPTLDHLSVIAPSLKEGVEHVRACLGIDVPFGRKHASMGTHNHLLRLGDAVYLEVIAIDENAPPIGGPRWFDLDNRTAVRKAWGEGRRLRGWVASTDHFDRHICEHASIYGQKREFQGSASSYFFSIPEDGSLPMNGVAPSLIDRQGKSPSFSLEAEKGCKLIDFSLEHPDAEKVRALYRTLKIAGAPTVTQGVVFRYAAKIRTPEGIKMLF